MINSAGEPTNEPEWDDATTAAYLRFLQNGGSVEVWNAANPELLAPATPGTRASDAENWRSIVEDARALGRLDYERKARQQAEAAQRLGGWGTLLKVLRR